MTKTLNKRDRGTAVLRDSKRPFALILLLVLWGHFFEKVSSAQATQRPHPDESRCQARQTLSAADKELKLGHDTRARVLSDALRKCTAITPREKFDLGLIYGRLHDFPTALALFRAVDKSVPNLQAHAYAIALGQFELADYQGAIETLNSLSPQVPLNANSANLLAVCYSKAARYQEAYTLLVGQIRSSPNDPLGYLNLITLLTDVGQLEQAVKVATSAVQAFPDNSQMLVVRGAAYTSVSELDKARSDFAAAVAMSPKKADPRFFLAVTDYKKGDYAIAAEELRTAIASGVVDADLEYLLAECILKVDPDKTQDAMHELDRAIRIDDRAVPAYTLRGKLLLEAGDARSAAADLEKAHSIDPAMRSPTYNLARAYMALGRKAEANLLLDQIHQQATNMVNDLSDQRMQQALADHSRSR